MFSMVSVMPQLNENEEIERLKGRSTSHKDRLTQLNSEIEEIVKKNEELTKLIDVLREDAGKLRSQSGTSKTDTENLIKQREVFEKQSAELRIAERDKQEEKEKR